MPCPLSLLLSFGLRCPGCLLRRPCCSSGGGNGGGSRAGSAEPLCCRSVAAAMPLCARLPFFLFVFFLLRFIFLPLSPFIFSFVLFLHFVHGSKQESVRERLVPSPAWWACKNRRTRPLAFSPNLRATAAAALHNKRRHSRTRAPARSLVSLLAPLSASRAYSGSSLAPLGNNSAPQCKKIKRRKRRKEGCNFWELRKQPSRFTFPYSFGFI